MAKASRVVGSTSNIFLIMVLDTSSATGGGLTNKAYNTAGLTAYYKRDAGTASVSITLADITTLGTFVSGGFKKVDDTNMPGLYEFHPPDAAFNSGAKSVVFHLRGITNMAETLLEVELTATNNQDGTAGGISRLDAAVTSRMASYTNPTNFSSLVIDGSGRVDISKIEGSDATDQIRDSVFNGVVENSKTFVQLFRGCVAALLGKASGLAGTTAAYRDNADSKDRISATVDADGNRSAVTLDLT